jgi:hypothetical protein
VSHGSLPALCGVVELWPSLGSSRADIRHKYEDTEALNKSTIYISWLILSERHYILYKSLKMVVA